MFSASFLMIAVPLLFATYAKVFIKATPLDSSNIEFDKPINDIAEKTIVNNPQTSDDIALGLFLFFCVVCFFMVVSSDDSPPSIGKISFDSTLDSCSNVGLESKDILEATTSSEGETSYYSMKPPACYTHRGKYYPEGVVAWSPEVLSRLSRLRWQNEHKDSAAENAFDFSFLLDLDYSVLIWFIHSEPLDATFFTFLKIMLFTFKKAGLFKYTFFSLKFVKIK